MEGFRIRVVQDVGFRVEGVGFRVFLEFGV